MPKTAPPPDADDLIAAPQVARIIGLSRRSALRYIHEGRFGTRYDVGDRGRAAPRVRKSAVIAWLNARTYGEAS